MAATTIRHDDFTIFFCCPSFILHAHDKSLVDFAVCQGSSLNVFGLFLRATCTTVLTADAAEILRLHLNARVHYAFQSFLAFETFVGVSHLNFIFFSHFCGMHLHAPRR